MARNRFMTLPPARPTSYRDGSSAGNRHVVAADVAGGGRRWLARRRGWRRLAGLGVGADGRRSLGRDLDEADLVVLRPGRVAQGEAPVGDRDRAGPVEPARAG